MSRRSDILDEMGLAPRWQPREGVAFAAPGAVAVPATPASTADPAAVDAQAMVHRQWLQLEAEVSGCTACPLAATRKCTVFGVGDRRASWLFVGEGPGAEEDERGEPFVGQAGRLLDNMLAALGMRRGDDVYVANIVKCRPPANRVPAATEVAACEPYLHRQIALLRPRVIVALGKTAAVTLLGQEQSIASMRGKVFRYRDTPLMVTYHPAYLLRTLPDKIKAWEDLCFISEKVAAWRTGGTDAATGTASSPPAA
jgi:DNA polymerase